MNNICESSYLLSSLWFVCGWS